MLCQVCVLAVSRMSPPHLPTLLVARVVDVVAVCEQTNKKWILGCFPGFLICTVDAYPKVLSGDLCQAFSRDNRVSCE